MTTPLICMIKRHAKRKWGWWERYALSWRVRKANWWAKVLTKRGWKKNLRGLKRDGGGWGEEKRVQRLMAVHIIFCQSVSRTSSVTTDVTMFWLLGGRRVLFSKHRGVVDSVSRWISCLQSTLAHMMVFQCWKRDNFYLLCKRQAENFHLGLKKTEFSVSQWLLQNIFCIIMLHMDIKDRNTRPECFRITFSTCGRSEKQNRRITSVITVTYTL